MMVEERDVRVVAITVKYDGAEDEMFDVLTDAPTEVIKEVIEEIEEDEKVLDFQFHMMGILLEKGYNVTEVEAVEQHTAYPRHY